MELFSESFGTSFNLFFSSSLQLHLDFMCNYNLQFALVQSTVDTTASQQKPTQLVTQVTKTGSDEKYTLTSFKNWFKITHGQVTETGSTIHMDSAQLKVHSPFLCHLVMESEEKGERVV